MKPCPGEWVIIRSILAASVPAWGVTPQAQKTGTSPAGRGGTGPQKIGCYKSAPMWPGSPTWSGAPWLKGNRDVTWVAVMAWAGVSQRIVTTMLP